MMRKAFVLSFCTFSCVQVLCTLAFQDLGRVEEGQDLNLSKPIMVNLMQGKKGPNDYAQEFAGKLDALFPEKAQRGKGSYGGANVVHHRPTEKSVASPLQSFSFLVPTSVLCITLFFLQVSTFLIV